MFFDILLLLTAATFLALAERIYQNNKDYRYRIPGTATPHCCTNHTSKFARPVSRFPPFIRQSDWTNTPGIYDTLFTIVFHDVWRFELHLGSLSLCQNINLSIT
jgi:hypothetical protein